MDHLRPEIAHAMRRSGLPKRRGGALRVVDDAGSYPVMRLFAGGFSVAVEDAARLRGFVDLYSGEERIARCLIVTASNEEGVMRYEYKQRTEAAYGVPCDYVIEDAAPRALLSFSG